jgi:hypothetical protein
MHFVSGFCNSLLKALRLHRRFNSQMNFASLGLGLPKFTSNMCGEMKILMRFDLIISSNSFPSTYGPEF